MSPETSGAAVAVRVPAHGYAGLRSVGAVSPAKPVQLPANDGTLTMGRARVPRGVSRLLSALGDIVGLVAVAYAFPLVILAIGIPVALLVRLVMWIVHAL